MIIKKEDENLKRLSKSKLITNFVKGNKGCWDHQSWLEFCANLEDKGYAPIDFDQVGLLLENAKAAFFSQIKLQ